LRLFIRLLALLLVYAAGNAALAADAPRIVVRTGEHADHSRIVFDWTAPVGATVEQPDAGQLVIVFDRPAAFDFAKASVGKLSRVTQIEPVNGRSAVRIKLRGARGHKLMNVDYKIVVDILGDTAGTASVDKTRTKKTTRTNKQDQANHTQTAAAAAPPVAAAASGRSTAADQGDNPLLVLSLQPPAAAGRPDIADTFQPLPRRGPFLAEAAPIETIPDPLFDPGQWRGGSSYPAGTAKLAARLSAEPGSPETLLALAQFQFAWRHADEALSVLDTLKARHPTFATRIEVLALRDAAQILAGRPRRLAGVFERTGVRDRAEAKLWRGAAAALSGRPEAAIGGFEAGRSALDAYPPTFRSFFGLLAMDAAIRQQATDVARAYETIVAESAPDPDEAAMLEALTGLLLLREQKPDAARPHLVAAARSPALKPQIVARLALVELNRNTGRLDAKGALEALEQLHYSWEGDALQLDILERMIALLTGQKRYDEAFDAAAVAKERFPTAPGVAQITEDARRLFRDLMTGDAGHVLDPIEAVALYDAHPELRPGDAESTAITRGLAKRLAGLDLAGPALRFYEAALAAAPAATRADIGAETADLRLSVGDAAGALAVLDATQQEGLPAATEAHRADTRARALARTGNNAAALTTIGSGTDAADARSRADLYWRNSEWDHAAAEYLHAAGEDPDDINSPAKARLVVRAAAALLLAGKAEEVVAVKTKYGPALAKSEVAAVFDKLTAPDAGVEVLALPEVSAEIVRLD
jgi:tetratricopeptide (TPR) repeat protein